MTFSRYFRPLRLRVVLEEWKPAARGNDAGTRAAARPPFLVGYEGRWGAFTPGGVSREDRTWNLRASVFNRAFTVYGFSPQLVLVKETRESNAQLYDYERTRAELRFVRQF